MALADFTLLSGVSPGSSPGGCLPLVCMDAPSTSPSCAECPEGLSGDKNSFVVGSKSPLVG